ncbi:hypothetical protein KVG29_10610 [Caldicoprobacter algeriensis]|uniref:hypothetical protein n=1 Tax=Caldicoprobacter algeriensis TaxID=699281 RepID=UPI00207ADBC4|nr:hypothetical protein [Caldicoprobacter algeriensis]MCM8901670.1 hypothetical protein [Caldicoprobacter algeriensis]
MSGKTKDGNTFKAYVPALPDNYMVIEGPPGLKDYYNDETAKPSRVEEADDPV